MSTKKLTTEDEAARCALCRAGHLEEGTTTLTLEREGTTLVFKEVPADVCDVCGEAYLDGRVLDYLSRKVDEAVEEGVEVDVRHYIDSESLPRPWAPYSQEEYAEIFDRMVEYGVIRPEDLEAFGDLDEIPPAQKEAIVRPILNSQKQFLSDPKRLFRFAFLGPGERVSVNLSVRQRAKILYNALKLVLFGEQKS